MEAIEELRGHIYAEKYLYLKCIIDEMQDSTEFSRGMSVGYISAIDQILDQITRIMKHE